MTRLLELALEKVQQLPPDLQDAIAASLLADIDGELRWDQSLEESSETLSMLAEEALREEREGRTSELDPDSL